MIPRRLRQRMDATENAERRLDASERRIVDIAKRLSRLEAEVELAERSTRRRGHA